MGTSISSSSGGFIARIKRAVSELKGKDGSRTSLIVDGEGRLHVTDGKSKEELESLIKVIGEVQDEPTSFTLLARLKDIVSGVAFKAGEAIVGWFRIKRSPLHWFDTGTGTTFKVFNPQAPHKLLEIRFKTTALAAGEDLTITRTNADAGNGRSTYHNVILFFEELGDTGTLNLTMPFGSDEGFMTKDDSLVFALSANTGADRWGLEVIYELV